MILMVVWCSMHDDYEKQAGIKVWIITGDKRETAVNVGYSSHLFDRDFHVISVKAKSTESCRAELKKALSQIEKV